MSTVLTVSQINTYIKSIVDSDFNLKNIYVSGEISNFTNHYRTGHFYFTLKDSNAAIKAVMFRSAAERVRFEVENGMKVIIRGNISVFERDGVYQLYCEDMIPDGQGALNLAFEQLKRKLYEQGMFSDEHKKPLPQFPKRIGVITSPTGAAVHDILTVLERRYPLAEVVFEPVAVQGENAAPQIVAAIEKFNRLNACDVLIVGRGGGSIEDLWAFNEESVAHAVYDSQIPIISAVGHETDYTIADFVSDRRAPTPSAAAEIAVPDYRELLYTLDKALDSMMNAVLSQISGRKALLSQSEKHFSALSPQKRIIQYADFADMLAQRMNAAVSRTFSRFQSETVFCASRLESVSPLKTLERGFAVALDEQGNAIKSAALAGVGDEIGVRLSDGELRCTVNGIVMNENVTERNNK